VEGWVDWGGVRSYSRGLREDHLHRGGGAGYSDVVVDTYTLGFERVLVKAHTLLASGEAVRPDAQPSKRYLGLLRSGAREHNLPREYIKYLDELQEYKRTTWRQSVGMVVWSVLWIPVMFLLSLLMVALKGSNGRSPGWLIRVMRALITTQWSVYGVVKPVFGDGEHTQNGKPVALSRRSED
jgi:hypothetical protein